jgi:hypothetical protein
MAEPFCNFHTRNNHVLQRANRLPVGQPRTPAGKFRDTATGLTHLVEFLKPWRMLCKPLSCSPADEHLQRFDDYAMIRDSE